MRATDIKGGEINTETLLHIAVDQPKHMDKCLLGGDELILVRSGVNTGDCAVVPPSLAGAYAAYDLILTFKPSAIPSFVATFLDTELGRLQLNLVRGRAAQPHVNAEEVSALIIPLPNPTTQAELMTVMDAARAARRAKLAEAEALLAGLDDFLLDTLGLTLPPEDERKVFAITLSDIRGRRLDPPAFQPLYTKESPPQTPLRELHELAIIDGRKVPKPSDENSLVPYVGLPECNQTEIREVVMRPYQEVKGRHVVYPGDILFARIEPSIFNQKYVLAEDLKGFPYAYTSTEFYVVTPDPNKVVADYLYAMFFCSFVFVQSKGKTTGSSGRRRLEPELFRTLQIPLPERSVQTHIAQEVRHRREAARRLRAEAEAAWQAAKQWFEAQLLGTPTP